MFRFRASGFGFGRGAERALAGLQRDQTYAAYRVFSGLGLKVYGLGFRVQQRRASTGRILGGSWVVKSV